MAGKKPESLTFTQNWQKTVAWAKSNNIPFSSYYPVYQMDQQRLTSGTPMSQSERIRAIESANGLSYTTALPTDNPNWKDIVGNSKRNAQDIFVGLAPQHILPTIFDTVKNTIVHPSSWINPIKDLATVLDPFAGQQQTRAAEARFGKDITGQPNILSMIPGVYDIGQALNPGGVKNLANDPITSLLDIIPF